MGRRAAGGPCCTRKFQAAGDKAVKTKEKIVRQIIELLTVHTYIENEVMYPEVCALLPDLKDDIPARQLTVVAQPGGLLLRMPPESA